MGRSGDQMRGSFELGSISISSTAMGAAWPGKERLKSRGKEKRMIEDAIIVL